MAPIAVQDGARNGMPLTEYSADPISTPAEKTPASALLPDDFLLPDGHPDVRKRKNPHSQLQLILLVPTIDSHLSCLRCHQRNRPHACNQPQQPIRVQSFAQKGRPAARIQL